MPTWNYIAVHAYGTLELVDDDAGKDALLAGLIQANEPAFAEQWRNMPDGFRRTMLAGIQGFRIPIARIEGKFKISQNRAPEERAMCQPPTPQAPRPAGACRMDGSPDRLTRLQRVIYSGVAFTNSSLQKKNLRALPVCRDRLLAVPNARKKLMKRPVRVLLH